jgi:hypothetical protein
MSEPTFYWHIHHDRLVEPATEPIENRIAFIKKNKSAEEVETRLRLLKPVKGKLPEAYDEARRAYDEAWRACAEAGRAYVEAWRACAEAGRAYDEAWRAYDEARRACAEASRAFDEAGRAHAAEIEALHAEECPDCPWDGKTIFPGEAR